MAGTTLLPKTDPNTKPPSHEINYQTLNLTPSDDKDFDGLIPTPFPL